MTIPTTQQQFEQQQAQRELVRVHEQHAAEDRSIAIGILANHTGLDRDAVSAALSDPDVRIVKVKAASVQPGVNPATSAATLPTQSMIASSETRRVPTRSARRPAVGARASMENHRLATAIPLAVVTPTATPRTAISSPKRTFSRCPAVLAINPEATR